MWISLGTWLSRLLLNNQEALNRRAAKKALLLAARRLRASGYEERLAAGRGTGIAHRLSSNSARRRIPSF
jgi:hypothetical protein